MGGGGYEEPQYVFGILAGIFTDDDPEVLLCRLGPTPGDTRPVSAQPRDASVRHVLAVWLDFLDRETWYVRRAFYVGLVPLLRRLLPAYGQADTDFVPEDLLFLELNELTSRGDAGAAGPRRAKYLADTEYFAKYGITTGRLRAVMETV